MAFAYALHHAVRATRAGGSGVALLALSGLGLMLLSRRLRADAQWRDLATYTFDSGITVTPVRPG